MLVWKKLQSAAQYVTVAAIPPSAGLLVEAGGCASIFAVAGLSQLTEIARVPCHDHVG